MNHPVCTTKTIKMEEQIMETIIEMDKEYLEKMPSREGKSNEPKSEFH